MKSTSFVLKYPEGAPNRVSEMNLTFVIPTLPAYAIEYSEFSATSQMDSGQKEFVEGMDYFLDQDKLIWQNFEEPFFKERTVYRLVIHYHGIRDFRLLFPQVQEPQLQERLGMFYEEAEVAFDNGAWLCFSIMCGAIYEGLLYFHFQIKDMVFSKMIDQALSCDLIDNETATIMHSTRTLRNLVHGGKYVKPYVSRLQAMDMRKVMDKLIKRDWK